MDEIIHKERRPINKTIPTIIGICMVLFGMAGFIFAAMGSAGTAGADTYYDQHALNEKNGIAVDSSGNIYVGEGETGSIQVYDGSGGFEYGFRFPTGGGGWFSFGIDAENKIHVVTARTDSYFVFSDGELVYSEEDISNDRSDELQAEYDMSESN
nr:hypothetical protein [Aminivibrio sp.]